MKKILLGIIMFMGCVGMAGAQVQQIADISIYNFAVEEKAFSFDVINNLGKSEEGLRYGISLKGKNGVEIQKVAFEEIFQLQPNTKKSIQFSYDITDRNIENIALYIVNERGLPLAVSMVSYRGEETIGNIQERNGDETKINYFSSCEVLNENNDSMSITCNEDMQEKGTHIWIYEKSEFGKKIVDEDITWEKTVNGEKETWQHKLPVLAAGRYIVKIEGGTQNKTFRIIVPGNFAHIDMASTSNSAYNKGDIAEIKTSFSGNQTKVKVVYGVVDGKGQVCATSTETVPLNISKVDVEVQKKCLEAEAFVVLIDSKGRVLDSVGDQKNTIEFLSVVKSEGVDKIWDMKRWFNMQYILYIAMAMFALGIITWFTKKKTFAIAMVIMAVITIAGVFGYSQIFAATFSGQDNIYTINFSEQEYTVDDVVGFTLGVFDKNTFQKEADTSISISIDGGNFNEVVSSSDTAEVYDVAIGTLSAGTHQVKVRGITAARFNISKFSISKFGQNNDDMTFTVLVKRSTIDCSTQPAQPKCIQKQFCLDNPTDPTCTSCVVTNIYPQPSEICDGVQFVQNTNCPNENYINTGTNTTNAECISECVVDDASWLPKRNQYCDGEKFMQTSNCGSTMLAIGTSIDPTCIHAQNANLLCSKDRQNWVPCDSQLFTLASGYSPLFIRPDARASEITNWLFQDASGGINAGYINGVNGMEDIVVKMNPRGSGIHGNNKFYNLNTRAVGIMAEYTTIKLKFIKPITIEI